LLRRRWFRSSLYDEGTSLVRLRGIKRPEATSLATALRRLTSAQAVEDAAVWRATVEEAVVWNAAVVQFVSARCTEQRWITTEETDALIAKRPEQRLLDRVRAARFDTLFDADELTAAAFLDADIAVLVSEANEEIMAAELSARRTFFDTIEKSPLTDEQARAVVCFDNRVQVLAAAGSGKTSVMVARAAYAVSRGFVAPERILLLAFNKAAASELQERVTARFTNAGIDSTGIRASTFHSFGLSVIGSATGEKPRLAQWLEQGQDLKMVMRIVDELRDTSASFRYHWDLYRLLFANAPTDLDEKSPDGFDKAARAAGYQTFAGTLVKSHGERLIADFLYLNGVEFEYERTYDYSTADANHSEYRPDFYYPAIDVWHEHWALDQDGQPPTEFLDYARGMKWKRGVHAEHGTRLVESTWAEVMFGDGLAKLEAELKGLGLTFDWNPDRQIKDPWVKPMKHEDLARLVRTFMSHVKSNSWTAEVLERRLASELARLNGFRTRLFLDVYWQIHAEWEKRLGEDDSVDFEDMLVQAADHLETGRAECPYDLIMVDEFQDASQARARLVRGLVSEPGHFLLAVGDDWQSINRFAGADLSVMTRFEGWFGRGPQLALTTTFRCAQTICDVARAFVSKNPSQFNKPMRSVNEDSAGTVTVMRSNDDADAVASYLDRLSAGVGDGSVIAGSSGTVSVDVLGRYGFQREVVPRNLPPKLDVTFRTMHGSKGLEADYIVIPGMTTGTYGIPSNVTDDPVLYLAMPAPESFAHAEERRLLYVALTRARREVVLITPPDRMSPFVVELLEDPYVKLADDEASPVEICPQCGEGTMVVRSSRFGQFLACSTFPLCMNKRNL
jgi:DNA helicase-4